ncbi:MAG TPA: hypothetical protein VK806_08440, partial [Bacteroidia bacterium]|nr:hypothetical protein [Bacteroidia bacterium]
MATIIKEMIASGFGLRAKMLGKGIKRMLDDSKSNEKAPTAAGTTTQIKLSTLFYNNPGIKYLAEKNKKKPSYLEASVFSKTVIDMLKGKADGSNTVVQIKNNIDLGKIATTIKDENDKDMSVEAIIESDTRTYLLSLISDSNNDIDKFRASLEQWFNNTMDRTTGWYKNQAQLILLVIGFVMAVGFNVDTIGIVGKLSKDKDAADRMATLATAYVKNPKSAKFI